MALGLVNNKCMRFMIDPSNSIPLAVVMVIGENVFQTIFSQIFVAINNEIPEPSP